MLLGCPYVNWLVWAPARVPGKDTLWATTLAYTSLNKLFSVIRQRSQIWLSMCLPRHTDVFHIPRNDYFASGACHSASTGLCRIWSLSIGAPPNPTATLQQPTKLDTYHVADMSIHSMLIGISMILPYLLFAVHGWLPSNTGHTCNESHPAGSPCTYW